MSFQYVVDLVTDFDGHIVNAPCILFLFFLGEPMQRPSSPNHLHSQSIVLLGGTILLCLGTRVMATPSLRVAKTVGNINFCSQNAFATNT